MTGEMATDFDLTEWPFHKHIVDLTGGEAKPFDKYQGPYVRMDNHKLWVIFHGAGFEFSIYDERTERESSIYSTRYSDYDLREPVRKALEEINVPVITS